MQARNWLHEEPVTTFDSELPQKSSTNPELLHPEEPPITVPAHHARPPNIKLIKKIHTNLNIDLSLSKLAKGRLKRILLSSEHVQTLEVIFPSRFANECVVSL